jgi:Fe(II)/alpha-ketoglutarate-dependent arginine beta-hydroxylase
MEHPMTATVEYTLDTREAEQLRAALAGFGGRGESPVGSDFYERRWDIHRLLPLGLQRFLEEFRRKEPTAACLVHGFPVDDTAVGPTPADLLRRDGLDSTLESDLFVAACGLSLGEPFCWATLQFGRMLQDVFPIKGEEQRLSGHGSEAYLVFHTDDAFHPDTPDYLLLFGVRNRDAVPTLVSSVRDLDLNPDDRRVLAEERFNILPDDEHIRQLETYGPDNPALQLAIEMRDKPRPVSVFFGSELNPYIRVDGPFMRCIGDDAAAERALAALYAELERVRREIVIDPGTLLVIDNKVCAHGRTSFTARYDGTDRWLRKILVSRGRRRWSGNSTEAGGRVLF